MGKLATPEWVLKGYKSKEEFERKMDCSEGAFEKDIKVVCLFKGKKSGVVFGWIV